MANISDDLAASLTKTLNLAQLDIQNQDKLFNGGGDVTITRPDGSTFTGASWRKMMSATTGKANAGANSDITGLSGLTTALSVAQGGTGGKTAAAARTGLGLGDAATKNTGEGDNDALGFGSFGVGAKNLTVISDLWDKTKGTRFCNVTPSTSGGPGFYATGIRLSDRNYGTGTVVQQQSFSALIMGGKKIQFLTMSDGVESGWMNIYHTGNTTKSSDGTLKAASPVARIVKSQDENQRNDIAKDGFYWCGCGAANDEATGVSISRLDIGVYVITGATGLATEGWQLLPPMDPLGSGELGLVEAEQTESGGIMVYLFRRKYMLSDDGEIVKAKGEPIDVPANSWIDVRLDMPANNIRNY